MDLLNLVVVMVVMVDLQDQVQVLAAKSVLADKTATMESVPAVGEGETTTTTTTTTTMVEGGNAV